ncbi:MAG: amidohydrolase [Balneolales bacterium]|nr:amidohydrolase [Balneolales bacterium]
MSLSEPNLSTYSVTELQNELVELRRHLHQYPELSWGEYETSRLIISKLEALGLNVVKGLAQTGFYVDFDSAEPGPGIAWRADMDALPIQDEKNVPYASKVDGISHMCGHDVHTSIAYGVAKLLATREINFKGKIRIFWQPAEEQQPSGSPDMIRDGVLDGIDAVYGMHCDPHVKSGKISLRPGPETAAFDAFQFEINSGSTQHSARPHKGPDAMWVGHQMVQNIYQFAGRMVNALEPTVVSVCQFNAGTALNIIPKQVYIGGTIRTVSDSRRADMKDYLTRLAISLEKLHNVTIKTDFGLGAPAVVNHPVLYRYVRDEVRSCFGDKAFEGREQSMGAEDFSFYTSEKPGLFIRVGTGSGPETNHPLHSCMFDIDETILSPTASFIAHILTGHSKKNLQLS